jgi:hypothetical protein
MGAIGAIGVIGGIGGIGSSGGTGAIAGNGVIGAIGSSGGNGSIAGIGGKGVMPPPCPGASIGNSNANDRCPGVGATIGVIAVTASIPGISNGVCPGANNAMDGKSRSSPGRAIGAGVTIHGSVICTRGLGAGAEGFAVGDGRGVPGLPDCCALTNETLQASAAMVHMIFMTVFSLMISRLSPGAPPRTGSAARRRALRGRP